MYYMEGLVGVSLAAMPYLPSSLFDPDKDIDSDIADKREKFERFFGFGIVSMVGQGLILSGRAIPPLAGICGILACMAVTDKGGKYRATMYKMIHAANLILGAVSLYSGFYAFGCVAVVSSSLVLLNKNVNRNGLGDGDYFLRRLNTVT